MTKAPRGTDSTTTIARRLAVRGRVAASRDRRISDVPQSTGETAAETEWLTGTFSDGRPRRARPGVVEH